MSATSGKLNLILMRDDGEARSIRISKKGLWLLIVLTILSPLTGLMGLWVGWEAWQTISGWQQEKLAYQIQVDELRVQLERFATLEALLKRQDAALSAGKMNAQNKTLAEKRNGKYSPQEQESGVRQGTHASVSSINTSQNKNKIVDTAADGHLGTISFLDHGLVKIEDVQIKILDTKRIQIRFGLFSTEKTPQISGNVRLSLVTDTGKKYELSGSETSFRISRFKSVMINSPLPVERSFVSKTQLLIEVIAENKVVYRQTYPVIDN